MSKRTRMPVPPLGEAAISRIERGLFAALEARPLAAASPAGARRRGLAVAAVGVAAAVALFGAREWRRGEGPTRATQISTTTSGSRIAIAGATLEVAPHSAISVGGGRDGAVVVALERGTVTCEVEPRSKRAPFIVEAGATHVTVIGTRFSVHRVGEHATVSVEHGLVEVADTDMTELVHAGERFVPGQPVTREPLASETPAAAPEAPAKEPAAPAS
ncbi:MAG TPA: FecR family protein, partial [Polyangia bacterium]|nr:FecR family protein [Polyangia bacterium]